VFTVKNGFATLNDKLFIGKMSEMAGFLGDPNMIFCTKASKNILQSIIYPYDKEGKPLKFEELSIPIQNILLRKAYELKVDTTKKSWYLYGRSQAINDTYKDKIAINNLLRTSADLKIVNAPAGTGVYSGLYITSDSIDISIIKKCLSSEEFTIYISLLGKYKSGGYYTFSSKDIKAYLDYKLAYDGGMLQ